MSGKDRSSSRPMGISGALFFIILLIGGIAVAYYVGPPILNYLDTQLGMSMEIVFLGFMGCVFFVLIFLFVKSDIFKPYSRPVFKERDPSICKRVICDGLDGPEVIVSGKRETTFAQACLENWQFQTARPKERWFIKDARGNDVTDRPLDFSDGVFILYADYGSEQAKEELDESDRYSSIHDSVEYYD